MANLEIQIGADSSELNSEIAAAESKIKRLGKLKVERVKLGLDVKELNSDINQAKAQLTSLNKATQATGQSFNAMTPKVANGGNALMQFSRIAQDAPYGIMGIGNNITATVEAFGHLKNSTGSTGGALKALAGSIVGSGGILLAVSLLTTGLTYMSQNGITVGDVFNKLTGNFDGYASALKKVNEEAYKDDGVKSAISNVNELKINIDLAKKGFLDKNQVVEQYNKTIGKTTGLVSSLDEAEKEITKNGDAYIKMTLYKAAANLALEEAAKKTLEAEKSRVKKLTEFSNAFLDADLTQTRSKEQYEAKQQNLKRQAENRQKEEVKINQDAANKNISIAKKFQEDAARISKSFNFNLFGDTKADKTKTSSCKESERPELSTVSALVGIDNEKLKAEGKKVIKTFEESLGSELNRFKETKIPLNIPLAPSFDQVKFDEMIGKLSEFDIAANEIIENSISSTFQNLGNVIGEAIANGGNVFQSFGNTLLQGLGALISSLGDKLIQLGTAAVLAGKVVKLFGTISGVGAGLAAIAGGVLLKGVGSAIATKGGQQGSGSVQGGNSYSSPTSSTGGGGGSSFQGGTVVFEISGQSLIGVLSNTLDRNRRLGGSLSLG